MTDFTDLEQLKVSWTYWLLGRLDTTGARPLLAFDLCGWHQFCQGVSYIICGDYLCFLCKDKFTVSGNNVHSAL